jgi:hypothetical protein
MFELESMPKRKLGSVLAVEMLGTSLLVAAFNITNDVLAISCVYFVCVLLTFEVSGA